jgi:hypothetical protein
MAKKSTSKSVKTVYSRTQVKHATSLHKKSAKQFASAAIKMGWEKSFVDTILNAEWTIAGLKHEAQRCGANKQQTQVLLDLHDAVRFEFAGMFKLSQM